MPTDHKTNVLCCRSCQRGIPFETPAPLAQVNMRLTDVKEKKDKLSKPYKLRIPVQLEETLLKTAQECNMTISAVLRECLLNSRPVFKAAIPVTVQKDRLEAIRLISKSSNNLNQIARHLNSLALRNQLSFSESIHFLRILDTIEAQHHRFLRLFDVN